MCAEHLGPRMVARQPSGHLSAATARHVTRTVLTLGLLLLLGAALGLASEILLREIDALSTGRPPLYSSIRDTLYLVIHSLQATAPLVAALVAIPLILTGLPGWRRRGLTASVAQERLNELVFGAIGSARQLSVREGRIASGEGPLPRHVGGPAELTVYDDSAVLTEQAGRIMRVLGAGVHLLRRHERIWETVDLRPQRWVRQVFAQTKEGLPIACEIDVVFQVDQAPLRSDPSRAISADGPPGTRSCSEEAVLRAATSQFVWNSDGVRETKDWAERVVSKAESLVRDTLAAYRLDWLVRAPHEHGQHARDEIHRHLAMILQDALAKLGVRLIEIRLGEIRIEIHAPDTASMQDVSDTLSDMISSQWIDAWDAKWEARAVASHGEGEAAPGRLETARAAAEMLVGLGDILQPLASSHPASQPDAAATRLIEALEWLSRDPATRDSMPPDALQTLRKLQDRLRSDAAESPTTGRPDEHNQPS